MKRKYIDVMACLGAAVIATAVFKDVGVPLSLAVAGLVVYGFAIFLVVTPETWIQWLRDKWRNVINNSKV